MEEIAFLRLFSAFSAVSQARIKTCRHTSCTLWVLPELKKCFFKVFWRCRPVSGLSPAKSPIISWWVEYGCRGWELDLCNWPWEKRQKWNWRSATTSRPSSTTHRKTTFFSVQRGTNLCKFCVITLKFQINRILAYKLPTMPPGPMPQCETDSIAAVFTAAIGRSSNSWRRWWTLETCRPFIKMTQCAWWNDFLIVIPILQYNPIIPHRYQILDRTGRGSRCGRRRRSYEGNKRITIIMICAYILFYSPSIISCSPHR